MSAMDSFFETIKDTLGGAEALDGEFCYSRGNPHSVRDYLLSKPDDFTLVSHLLTYVLAAKVSERKADSFQSSALDFMKNASLSYTYITGLKIPGCTHNSLLAALPEMSRMTLRYVTDKPVPSLLQLPLSDRLRAAFTKKIDDAI